MHQTLAALKQGLEQLIAQLEISVPSDEPLGIAHGRGEYPSISKSELLEEAQSLVEVIEDQAIDDLGEHEDRLNDYIRRLQHLKNHTVAHIWGSPSHGVPAYLMTLAGLRKALKPVLTRDGRAEAVVATKKLNGQIRNMAARVEALEPRTASLKDMVERIEQAYKAADELPEDLKSLEEARNDIARVSAAAKEDQGTISKIRADSVEIDKKLKEAAEKAEEVLKRCETAYAGATSVGLAVAFSERSSALSKSMWAWVGGLVAALVAGSFFGSGQLHNLSDLFKTQNVATSVIVLNFFLSMLSIGAPVWFSWLATKQIGQRFRLAEDYAFKASIARAYEGFRREAARFDKDMEARLLASALTRLDELPLRLVESDSHGSPWHELAKSDAVKQAMKSVPGFAERIKTLASASLEAVSVGTRQLVSKPTTASPSATTVTAQSTE